MAPGSPPRCARQVFQPDYSSRPGGGFGLGHAREVARAWRSDLVVDDPPDGRGAALRLMLAVLFPFEEGSAAPARETARDDRRPAGGRRMKPRLLLVEDDEARAALLARTLSRDLRLHGDPHGR